MTTPPPVTPPAPQLEQHRAVVRVDAEPGGKRFQGVWLDFGDAKRWVIAYRPNGMWKAFENHEVVVTGHCYAPQGQAIMATHFRVERMRFFTPQRGRGPLLEVGPAETMEGKFVEHRFPTGSKREGDSAVTFLAEGGTEYWIAGAEVKVPDAGAPARIRARRVDPDMSWVAQPGGPNLWLLGILVGPSDLNDDPVTPCPDRS